ncbi:Membrane-bound lytic murein transglycosylase B precursor [Aquimixticola soesokkakensis]|uniref:Membrane-bound lytic murein transglycosylase B n=1 Tax=Aquimixticola soesokkakensis TaxID=1519096 RepID=A0A1Y5RJ45_9RHOB|nr:lytic murein transglycosylase [Aquimixticola soesokkakensis]SLN17627.1 Membrane-bound lytic murein transglycosylase B precursor [Aquimixticola soesokkakensis]
MRLSSFLAPLALLASAQLANAANCGGNFDTFINNMKGEAISRGHAPATVDAFFASARQDPAVIKADRAQGVFQKNFVDFSRSVISQNRMQNGAANAQRFGAVFDRIEATYGISRGVLLAFWALETDYGQVQGTFNTRNALVTLAHDCRRPELFQPQVFAAISLFERGDFDPDTTQGAWAGEIGMVQMLPEDILVNGVDGDGDGHVTLKTSAPDALMSGAKVLSSLGWRAGEPWLQEITVPQNLDWTKTGLNHQMSVSQWQAAGVQARGGSLGNGGLPASVLLPMGRHGPAFLAYPNFRVYFEWNQSFVYVTTAAYFATRLSGAPVYDAGTPDAGLGPQQMVALQQKLQARGHDVGGVDGILGEKTREAVQAEQARLGLPADAWPTSALLSAL